MAIRQNPRSRAARDKSAEDAASRFIDQRDETPAVLNGNGKKVVVMKLDAALVQRMDAVAVRHGVSRTAWVSMKLTEALDRQT